MIDQLHDQGTDDLAGQRSLRNFPTAAAGDGGKARSILRGKCLQGTLAGLTLCDIGKTPLRGKGVLKISKILEGHKVFPTSSDANAAANSVW